MRGEREHCADDLAVRVLESGGQGTRLSYAKALVSLEERRIATAFAMAADGGSLVERIRRLSGVEAPQASAARLVAGVLATACMVAVVAAGAAAPRPALAADEKALPEDTNTITSLTPEEAKKLVAESGRQLFLRGLTTLSPEVTTALAQFKGDLRLNGLTTLDAQTAKGLAQSKGDLDLPRLTTLSEEVATELAQHKGWLSLESLATLTSVELATKLGKQGTKDLWFYELTTFSPKVAAALAQHEGGLFFFKVNTLSPEAIQALAQHQGKLQLNDLMIKFDSITMERIPLVALLAR
ncbi:MAG: hypothetical protein ACKOSQ_11920 [Planctomycetaceae bacterium]